MSFQVPLNTRNPSEGSITYLAEPSTLSSVPGFFSFTFYLRDPALGEPIPKQARLYIGGLWIYARILKDTFVNWKLLVYTDQFTYDQLQLVNSVNTNNREAYTKFRKNITTSHLDSIMRMTKFLMEYKDSIVFAIVDWPSHRRRLTLPQVDGAVLRPFRSRAPFDFPDKYIFIRDADTLFENRLETVLRNPRGGYGIDVVGMFVDSLYKWEETFYNLIPEILKTTTEGRPAIIAGTGSAVVHSFNSRKNNTNNNLYWREWHVNELTHKTAPFGVFAGFINITPNVPLYSTKDAWDDFVEYVDERSKRNNTKPMKGILLDMPSLTENTINSWLEKRKAHINTVKEFNEPYKEKVKKYFENQAKNIYYTFSNNGKFYRIGRDEQLYLFNLLPRALQNLAFFRVNLGDDNPPVFDKDFHHKMFDIYVDAVNKNFPKKEIKKLEPVALLNANTKKEGGKRKTRKYRTLKKKTRKTKGHA